MFGRFCARCRKFRPWYVPCFNIHRSATRHETCPVTLFRLSNFEALRTAAISFTPVLVVFGLLGLEWSSDRSRRLSRRPNVKTRARPSVWNWPNPDIRRLTTNGPPRLIAELP
ncbi:hypothetical protein BCAR13_1840014 [Paraburkholderia caribensis]|nr:hypothetical protein BCAR13_1840014 [Paraburkholderia caribensis]